MEEDQEAVFFPADKETCGGFAGNKTLVSITFPANGVLKLMEKEAFKICENLKAIEIPATVEEIGVGCFLACVNLAHVTFASGSRLKVISTGAFANCKRLAEIEIPASVESIGARCFLSTKSPDNALSSVRFASGSVLKTIGNEAFSGCKNLQEIEIPASVESIGDKCFISTGLIHVKFASGSILKTIGNEAFADCTNLSEIEIPASVEVIGNDCFKCQPARGSGGRGVFGIGLGGIGGRITRRDVPAKKIVGLTQIKFEVGSVLKRIGNGTFSGCAITNIKIPESVEEIGDSCFEKSEISSVTFASDSVLKRIGKNVFKDCKNLHKLTLPTSVEEIDASLFRESTISYSFAGESEFYHRVGQCLIHVPSMSIVWAAKDVSEVEIPSDIQIISACCFEGCSSLSRVTFQAGSCLKKIEASAFSGCTALEEIELPATVDDIGAMAFYGCEIANFSVSEANPHYKVLNGCLLCHVDTKTLISCPSNVEEVEIPADIEVIGEKCFANIHCKAGITITSSLAAPSVKCEKEKALSKVTFASGSSLKKIEANAFRGCKLQSIEIPAGVEDLGQGLQGCSFDKVTFAAGSCLKVINQNIDTKELTIPASVEKLNMYGASNLTKVTFEPGTHLTELEDEAFRDTSITEIEIPASIERIGAACFESVSLDGLVITFEKGTRVTELGDGAFWESGLKDFKIPASVKEIGEAVFPDCMNSITIEKGSTFTVEYIRGLDNLAWNPDTKITKEE